MSVGQDVLDAFLEASLGVLQHRRDRASVGVLPEPLEHGSQLGLDLGARRVGNCPLTGVVLEVDRALRKAVEPAPQRVAVEMAEAEHAAEAANRDRLEVLGHQLGRVAPLEPASSSSTSGSIKPGGARLDDARAERGGEHPT